MAPGNHSPKGSRKKEEEELWENAQKQILVLRAFKGPRGHGSMREPLEMVTVSLMQNMAQIHENNTDFATKYYFSNCWKKFFWGSRR